MDKQMHSPWLQGCEYFEFALTLLPQGEDAPTIGEGDSKNFYFTAARTAEGVYTLTTTQGAPGFVCGIAQPHQGTPAGVTTDLTAVQNADNSWTTTITCLDNGGDAIDLDNDDGDCIYVRLTFRNTLVLP